jgi:hypothetical protein
MANPCMRRGIPRNLHLDETRANSTRRRDATASATLCYALGVGSRPSVGVEGAVLSQDPIRRAAAKLAQLVADTSCASPEGPGSVRASSSAWSSTRYEANAVSSARRPSGRCRQGRNGVVDPNPRQPRILAAPGAQPCGHQLSHSVRECLLANGIERSGGPAECVRDDRVGASPVEVIGQGRGWEQIQRCTRADFPPEQCSEYRWPNVWRSA